MPATKKIGLRQLPAHFQDSIEPERSDDEESLAVSPPAEEGP